MNMNMKRGLWRLWLVSTVLLVITVFAMNYRAIEIEFEEQADIEELLADGGLGVPVLCAEAAKKHAGEGKFTSNALGDDQKFCWFPFSTVRKSWPEYSSHSDLDLLEEFYLKAGQYLPRSQPWLVAFRIAASGMGLPLVALALGWAAAGFTGASRKAE